MMMLQVLLLLLRFLLLQLAGSDLFRVNASVISMLRFLLIITEQLGICVRDAKGTFVIAKAISFPCVYPVDVSEELGLHNALQWSRDMQFYNIDFEIDFKTTCDTFHSTRDNIYEFGHIIASC